MKRVQQVGQILMLGFCTAFFAGLFGDKLFSSDNEPQTSASAQETAIGIEKEPARAVSVRILDWNGVQKMVRKQRGKVVVVNVWLSTCISCIEEFPEFVALQKQYGRDRLMCVSVNCDYGGLPDKPVESYLPDVQAFLEKQQATIPNVVIKTPLIEFLEQIDLSSSPTFYVYAPDGNLSKRFDNDDFAAGAEPFTMNDVRRLIDRLLATEASK